MYDSERHFTTTVKHVFVKYEHVMIINYFFVEVIGSIYFNLTSMIFKNGRLSEKCKNTVK